MLIHDNEEDEWQSSNSDDVVEENPMPSFVSVSFNSVIGIDNPKSMKLIGIIAILEYAVMIDPGGTHNLISLAIAEKLRLPITTTDEIGMTLGI